jgi:Fe-S-cluster containining protein
MPEKKECVRCGMCCTFPDPHVMVCPELTSADIGRLIEAKRPDLIVRLGDRSGIRSVTITTHSKCAALTTDKDGKAVCSIYEFRPEVCREWEAGCALCQHYKSLARRKL